MILKAGSRARLCTTGGHCRCTESAHRYKRCMVFGSYMSKRRECGRRVRKELTG